MLSLGSDNTQHVKRRGPGQLVWKKTATAPPPHAAVKTSSFPGPGRAEQHHGGEICLYLFLR